MKIKNIKRNNKGQFISVWDRHRIKCKCLECGEFFEEVESRIKAGRGRYCSINCYNKNKKGRRQSTGTEFKRTSGIGCYIKIVKENSLKPVCSMCNRKEKEFGRIIQVHHKDKNRKNNKISNLQVICYLC